jgi:hypothetical protein
MTDNHLGMELEAKHKLLVNFYRILLHIQWQLDQVSIIRVHLKKIQLDRHSQLEVVEFKDQLEHSFLLHHFQIHFHMLSQQ